MIIMPPPLIGGGIKRCCLTSVAYIGTKSRTERPRKTNWHRGSPRQAAAAVGVGTCWQWETAATLLSARRRAALRRPRRGERRGISWRPPAYTLLVRVSSSYRRLNRRHFLRHGLLIDTKERTKCAKVRQLSKVEQTSR